VTPILKFVGTLDEAALRLSGRPRAESFVVGFGVFHGSSVCDIHGLAAQGLSQREDGPMRDGHCF
jgi:hypothetical protein